MSVKPILDPASGSRMFYFNPNDERVVFGDVRHESHILKDSSSKNGYRALNIHPDVHMDFTNIPFSSDTFSMVVFDPPHLRKNGSNSWLAKKYGRLSKDWREDLRKGFSECFRVLKPNGTLIFKWNEYEIKVSEVLNLTNHKPIVGNRCGKSAKSIWLVFMKPSGRLGGGADEL